MDPNNCWVFGGVGVDAGVVVSVVASISGLGLSSESMSASLDIGASMLAVLAESPRALPKAPPKNESLGSFEASEMSSFAFGSALNVDPRTKPPDPKLGLLSNMLPAPPNTLPLFKEESAIGEPKALFEAGFEPNMLPVGLEAAPAAAAKPPLLANAANPEDWAGVLVAEAEAPKTAAGLARPPAWPKAALGAVDPPVAQGEARFPSPKVGVLVVPNDGAPNAGFGAAVEDVEPNVPKVVLEGAVTVEGVPQGDWLFPRADGPPKAPPAGAGREGAPKALEVVLPKAGAALLKAGAPKAGLLGAPNADVGAWIDAGEACAGCEGPSAITRPGYTVPCLIDSEYMIHHEAKTPSLLSTMSAGSGVGDSSISSVGIGLGTLSLLDRSRANPIGEVSVNSPVMGS